MESQRVQIKVYARDAGELDLEPAVPVFHRWIREDVLGELVIDVADYTHVHQGPGVVLIGHGADYYLEDGEGRAGLVYSRKRAAEGDFEARLEDAIGRALAAADRLEGEPEVSGQLAFARDELLLRIPDRLHAPNTDETLVAIRPALERVLGRVFAGRTAELAREGTEREPFAVRIRLGPPPADA